MGTELSDAIALEDVILSHPIELASRIFTDSFNLKYKLQNLKYCLFYVLLISYMRIICTFVFYC